MLDPYELTLPILDALMPTPRPGSIWDWVERELATWLATSPGPLAPLDGVDHRFTAAIERAEVSRTFQYFGYVRVSMSLTVHDADGTLIDALGFGKGVVAYLSDSSLVRPMVDLADPRLLDLLERHGLDVEDRHLQTEEEAARLREELDVETTPQTFIDGELVGTLDDLREYFGQFGNLQLAGRNGLHKYNNQDHAMITGILAAEALLGRKVDPWTVNVEDEYLEEGDMFGMASDLDELLTTQPPVPVTVGRHD